MVRICAEETFHHKQGKEMVLKYAHGTPKQKAMVSRTPSIATGGLRCRCLGPPRLGLAQHPSACTVGDQDQKLMMRFGRSLSTKTAPELLAAGLTIPDPDLRYDEESGNWIHGAN